MSNETIEQTAIHVPDFPRRSNQVPAVLPADQNPMAMIARAVQQGWEPERLKQLMDLQERWEANEGRKAFDDAIAAAKAEIPVIRKNREVDFTSQKGRTNYKYEDLAEIARTIDPILARHGLSYRFKTTSLPDEPVSVTCRVTHRGGHAEENTLSAARDESGNKNSIQAIGSTLTYLQRMTLKASLGLAAASDDDGRGAGRGGKDETEPDAEGKAALEKCASHASLKKTWAELTPAQRATLTEVMTACKKTITEADGA